MSNRRDPYREAAELPKIPPPPSWLRHRWKVLLVLSSALAALAGDAVYMQTYHPKPKRCISHSTVIGLRDTANCDEGATVQTQPLNNNTDSVLVICQCNSLIPEPPASSAKPKVKDEPTLEEPAHEAAAQTLHPIDRHNRECFPEHFRFDGSADNTESCPIWESDWTVEERMFCAKYDEHFSVVRKLPGAPIRCLAWAM